MAKAVRRGEVELPSDDEQAAMGEAVRKELARGGYARYEISNFAREGFEAVHNTLYWRGIEYVAAGCGACGFSRLRGDSAFARRYMNDRSPERYLARVEESVPQSGPVHLCIRVPASGSYALLLLHDRDQNHKFGWTVDGIGFSSNTRLPSPRKRPNSSV